MALTRVRAGQIIGLTNNFAPILRQLIPNSHLPNVTGNIRLIGSFFTPTMTVEIEDQTINYITFVNDNEVLVNVTTSSNEGYFNVILNNGISVTYTNALLLVLGDVFSPESPEDWNNATPKLVFQSGAVKIGEYGINQSAYWNKIFDYTKDFSFRFSIEKSSLGDPNAAGYKDLVSLQTVSNNTELFRWRYEYSGSHSRLIPYGDSIGYLDFRHPYETFWELAPNTTFEFRFLDGFMSVYIDNTLKRSFSTEVNDDLQVQIFLSIFDLTNIKYIELAT